MLKSLYVTPNSLSIPAVEDQTLTSSLPEIVGTDDGALRFGRRVDIGFNLPTNNSLIVSEFIENSTRLVHTLWDEDKVFKIDENMYSFVCKKIKLPGFGTYLPTLQLQLGASSANQQSFETSSFAIQDESGKAVESLDLHFRGALMVNEADFRHINNSVEVNGYVEYIIQLSKTR